MVRSRQLHSSSEHYCATSIAPRLLRHVYCATSLEPAELAVKIALFCAARARFTRLHIGPVDPRLSRP